MDLQEEYAVKKEHPVFTGFLRYKGKETFKTMDEVKEAIRARVDLIAIENLKLTIVKRQITPWEVV